MQYLHDNLNMHIIFWGKMPYSHYDLNPHYVWEMKMQYLHDNLNMHILCGGKMQYVHYDLKSTLFMGGQNAKCKIDMSNMEHF
jgi:hypothetical protein